LTGGQIPKKRIKGRKPGGLKAKGISPREGFLCNTRVRDSEGYAVGKRNVQVSKGEKVLLSPGKIHSKNYQQKKGEKEREGRKEGGLKDLQRQN